MGKQKYCHYEFGEFRLDVRNRLLLRNGELVHLTFKVFQLLLVLVENSGQLLEKDELMETVWPDAIVEEANLKNSISTLRKALGEERGTECFIQTLPKRGYRFIAPVTLLSDEGEIYRVEKRTTAEIIIDEVEVERPLASTDEIPVQTDNAQAVISAASGQLSIERSLTSHSGSKLLATEQLNSLSAVPQALALQGRQPKALTYGVVLVVVMALALGLLKWLSAGHSNSAFSFDKVRMTRLTNVGNTGAVISPDGKYIAYIMSGTPTDGLWVRQTATDSAIRLLPHLKSWGHTFTPDSNFVYCNLVNEAYPDGVLYKIPTLGGPAKLVLEGIGGGVSFSPDGKRLAFRRNNKAMGKPDVITANADGSDERIILPASSQTLIWTLGWSPDGKHIAYAVKNEPVSGQPPTWQVKEMNVDGTEERPISPPQKEAIISINWLPDGSGMIIIALDKVTELQQLWHLSYANGQVTRITNDLNWYTGTSITSDGTTMLAQRNLGTQSVWVAAAEDLNSLRKTIADQGSYSDLSWTPDGRVLHVEGEDGKSVVWVMNADGTARARLTDNHSHNDGPAISADGRYILFSSNRSGSRQLWRMDSDGRNPVQLTESADTCYQPKITADGQWIVYRAGTSSSLGWVVNKVPFDGGPSVSLAERIDDFAVSPDGKQLAYLSFDEQKKRDIITVKLLDGGEPKVLDYPDFPIFEIGQWTKDGLLCVSASTTQIILIPVDGRQPRQLTDYQTGERIYSFAFSPDGKRLILSRGNTFCEVVQLTDFKQN